MTKNIVIELEPIFNAKSLAIIGFSTRNQGSGSGFLGALREFGYKGKLYAVNPRGNDIPGFKVYPNVRDIPDPVDLALIMVPASAVPTVVEDCLVKGVKGVEIFSSGFSETGKEDGRKLEAELTKIARRGIRIIGPNCFGIYNSASKLTFFAGLDYPQTTGPVAFISQSGGHSVEFGAWAKAYNIGLSKVISYGNGCDLNEIDFLEYLSLDPETKIIAAYMEGVKDGRRLLETVRRVSRIKPVIIWKAGLTRLGARAVQSHTGALGGEERIWEGFFRQSGAIKASSLEEITNIITAFHYLPSNTGRKISVVGGGGGMGVVAADACSHAGLEIPPFDDDTQRKLRPFLPAAGTSVRNPVDFGGPMMPAPVYEKILEIVAGTDVDVIIVTQLVHFIHIARKLSESSGVAIDEILEVPLKIRERFGKPVVSVVPLVQPDIDTLGEEEERRRIHHYYVNAGIPVYSDMERAIKSISSLVQYYSKIQRD